MKGLIKLVILIWNTYSGYRGLNKLNKMGLVEKKYNLREVYSAVKELRKNENK